MLANFLESGPPPIYCGFGSIVGFDMAALYRKVIDACAQLRVRLIICQGWNRIAIPATPNVLVIEECPHDW